MRAEDDPLNQLMKAAWNELHDKGPERGVEAGGGPGAEPGAGPGVEPGAGGGSEFGMGFAQGHSALEKDPVMG